MSDSFLTPSFSERRLSFMRRCSSSRRSSTPASETSKGNERSGTECRKEMSGGRRQEYQAQVLGDSGMSRTELLDRLEEKENEIRKKEKQLRDHNDKFHQINNGLSCINEEREKLKKTVQRIEKEKKDLQRSLDMREKEVLSLVRRCSSQEERLKGSASLRNSTKELTNEVEELRSKLAERDDALVEMVDVRRKLSECQDEKEALYERFSNLKKDHDAVTDNFNASLLNIQRLSETQSENEDKRRREQQRAQLKLEQQRLNNLQNSNLLKEELQDCQSRIEQLEKRVQCHVEKNTKLQNLLDEQEKIQTIKLDQMQKEFKVEKAKMASQHREECRRLEASRKDAVTLLHGELDAKERVVLTLENEISGCMEKMMSLSTDLQSAKESTEAPQLSVAIEKLEAERRSLRDELSVKEAEVIELTGALCRFESDNILMQQKISSLQEREKSLQDESARAFELDVELRKTTSSLSEANRQKKLAVEKNERAITTIRQHLEEESRRWLSTEKALLSRISELESEKIESDQEHETMVNEFCEQINFMKRELETKEYLISETREQLLRVDNEAVDKSRSMDEEIQHLKRSLDQTKTELAMKDDEIRDLKLFELKDSEETIALLRLEVRTLKQHQDAARSRGSESAALLEAENKKLEEKSLQLEYTLSETKRQNEHLVEQLKQENCGLKEAFVAREAEAKSNLSKLKELHLSKSALARDRNQLAQRNQSLCSELEALRAEKENIVADQEKLVRALKREIHVIRLSQEEEDLANETKHAELQDELCRINDMMESEKQRRSEIEELLNTRTKLLADMVAYNKGVEEDIEKEKGGRTELETAVQNLSRDLLSSEAEVNRLREELKCKEEQLLEALESERHLREIAEDDLEKANRRLSRSIRGTKELTELEKENIDLKDKVRRQEAYLKRKLKKEKVLRDRSNAPTKTPLQTSTRRLKQKLTNGESVSCNNSFLSIPESATFPADWENDSLY